MDGICDRSWESRCINHRNFIVKSFMTVTVTVPLVIPMIDTWEIDPNFQVSTFTVTNSTRTSQKGYMWFDLIYAIWDAKSCLGLAESLIIVNQWSNFGSHLRSWDLATVFWLLLTRISDSGWGVLITTIWVVIKGSLSKLVQVMI